MENKSTEEKILPKNTIHHKLVVLSGKGGVGKSTVAAGLARMLSQQGHRVGLLDADLHGPSIPQLLGVSNQRLGASEQGIQPAVDAAGTKIVSMALLLDQHDTPVIWRGPMKMGAIKQFIQEVNWGELDFLIVDLPPGTGDEPLSIAQLLENPDGAIIVTTPQQVSLLSVRKSINFVKKLNIPLLGIVENMSGLTCPHCNKHIDVFSTDGGKQVAKEYKLPFLGKVPLDPAVVQAGDEGSFAFLTDDDSSTKKAFETLRKNIEQQISTKKKT